MSNKYLYKLILLTILGLFVSIYLAYLYSLPEPVTCIGEAINGCETVRNSTHSYFLGIRLPILGIIFFGSLIIGEILLLENKFNSKVIEDLILVSLIFGTIFETYKTVVQLVELKVICVWCFSIEVIVILLLTIMLLGRKNSSTD